MTLKTGMLVGIMGTEDMGVLIQIRSSSNTCVIKLNNGTLRKNVPLEDVEEAKDMTDTKKEKKSPIRLGGATESQGKSPSKLAALSVDARKSTDKLKPTTLDVGDSVRARCNGGSRWFPGRIIRVQRDGTYDVEYSDGDVEKRMAASDVEAASKLDKPPLGTTKKLDSLSFAVGDKVKARYKKGNKLFSGKIARVRSDGTYDVTYDDGDVETRVAKDLIEPKAEVSTRKRDSDGEAPKKKNSGGFRVDQSVKARYKGGKKLFSGKIKRVHSDGTYDILYEDGDEEKRVKTENIEATNDPKADSDEERNPSKATSSRSKTLTVGKKVKARYKKGKRSFPGKISRVRSDGTYDIDYDDGEFETRVEASQIDEEDMFADSDDDKKRTKSTKKKAGLEVGERVKAYYGKGKRLFPGKIAKVHMNGTYDVKYDDGDSEVRVDASLIEAAESDLDDREVQKVTKSQDSPKSGSKSSTKRPLRVGDAVKAKYKRGTRFFQGKITRERMDGTYDIKYEDGDVEERVEADLIQRVDDADEEGDKSKKKTKKSFEVGDVVKAPIQPGVKLFRGKISRVRSDGTYDLAFENGDRDTRVPGDLIQPEKEEHSTRDEKPKKSTLKVGDAVKARYKKGKKLFSGTVTRVRSDGTYDIKYDDGDVEMQVEIDMIEVPEGKKGDDDNPPKTKKSLKVGDKVRARYNKGSKMIKGEITAVHRDGTYDIRYEDGDKEKNVEAKDIEVGEEEREPQASKKSSSSLKVGDSIEANYKTGGKMFPGKISRVHSDGTYDVTFDDGDSKRRVSRSHIKAKADESSLPKKKTGFAVGDSIQAKYKKGTKYFSGKIARVRSDGTYDVEYDDGDSETRLDATLIVAAEPETARASENSPKPASKATHFEVRDVIKARYKKGTKLFSGKITRVRSDGTYDVRYDDGDTETYVESSYIEGGEKTTSRAKEDDKKREGFSVGDKVSARYKGGSKTFPGKIVKARLDGTFDIEYDDGETELRVKSSAIELAPGSKAKKPEAKASSDKDDIFGDSDSDSKGKKRTNKKSGSLKVGDVVEANFKQKGKFHRGKIVRARSDGTFDIEYDVGASEKHVRIQDIKIFGDNADGGTTEDSKKKTKPIFSDKSSDSKRESTEPKPKKSLNKSKTHSSSESSGSDREKQTPIKKGARVTFRKAEDIKSRRVGTVRKVHSDGSCDVKYAEGDTSKRIAPKQLVACSDSEDSDDAASNKGSLKRRRAEKEPIFRRNESVLCNWRRSSKLSKPRMTEKWTKAKVLEKNSDGTYTIRYSDGVVEEDAPSDALKSSKKEKNDSESSDESDATDRRRKRKLKRERKNGIGTESLFLLEQLAMTLFEEGALKKKPKLKLLRGNDSSSSSYSSSSSTECGSGSAKSSNRKDGVDKILKRLFDSSSLQNYRRMFKENDVKGSGKISRSRIIGLVEEFTTLSRPGKDSGRDDDGRSVSHILTEWFATHDDLRTHRHFEFKTLMLAFAYAKCRLGKLRMEQSVATVLEGRFASYHENKRQLELCQQKLGYRLFETLQRHFHDHALPNMIPSRIRVSELSLIFEQVARQAMPNKPLAVYLQQLQLFPYHTLLLPEFLCCYYQLYGSEHATSSRWSGAVELRPIAFVASCLFSNGDNVCKRHGDLVRRLSVGRTQGQADLILRFRETFESLMSTDVDGGNSHEELLLETWQLSAFAAQVAPDPSLLEPAMTLLRKRSEAVSLVEIYGSCGFIIDELTSAPTVRNAIEKMRMRVDLAEVRRIIGLVRNICVKILRFPNNADYWRIRADSAAFQQKIGRFDGATCLMEAVGFVEYQKTHYELRGTRNTEGKRVNALEKSILDALREKCVQLDGELSLLDGVESLSSILQRISKARESEGSHFIRDECQSVLKNLSSYLENVLKNPKDSRYWRIREANSLYQRQIGYLPCAMELMESIGFDLVQTSHGNAYTLRGTGLTGSSTKKIDQEVPPSASLSNFAFTSVSSQMEWFLWRRKQEIDSLLEDEMRYLHEIVGSFSHSQNLGTQKGRSDVVEARETALVKMYPYGTNAIDTFNKTSIQRLQLDMMRDVFNKIDVDQKGFLVETDFSRTYGSPSTLPIWSRFDAFDIRKDGKMDLNDFVAALGPLVDHSYDLTSDRIEEQGTSSSENDTNPTLCEVTSRAIGDLRLGTSCASAAVVLEALLSLLFSIIQEPGNPSLWSINDKIAIGGKLLRCSAGRELLRLVGFRESTNESSDSNAGQYELQPQRVRFTTSQSGSELPLSLDTATIARIQMVAAMAAGHYRGLKNPSVSDISAVSRAISASERHSENWIRVVQLGMTCLKNIESQPDNPRYRELNTATTTFTNMVSSVQGGVELLLSVGFRETDSGTLVIPFDTSLEEVKARRLELEVGLALLKLKSSTNECSDSQKLEQRSRVQSTASNGDSRREPAPGARELQGGLKKSIQQQHQAQRRGIVKGILRNRPATASTQLSNVAKRLAKQHTPQNQRPQSARRNQDPIEKEILSDFPHHEDGSARDTRMKTLNRRRSATNGLNLSRKTATMGNRATINRKQVQRRAPSKPPSASGHTMVLAENAAAGSDTIVVQKGQFVLRGAYVRIGAEIRDLNEERMVVEVSSNDDHTPELTRLHLGIPLRFFHPAKELVSTVLLSSIETAKRLEISDTQTFTRGIISDIVAKVVKQASMTVTNSQLKDEMESQITNSAATCTLVTSFEVMATLPIVSSNLCVGPSMRYVAAWSDSSGSDCARHNALRVSITQDRLSDRKLHAYWEGLLLQAGTSKKQVRLADVKQIVRRNAHLSFSLSTAVQEMETDEFLTAENEDSQLNYEGFRTFFQLPPLPKLSSLLNYDEEENEARLQLPLAHLDKNFRVLLQSTTVLTNGYKSVQVSELLHRVYRDVQDHPSAISDDPLENQADLETIQTVCQRLEKAFVCSQRTGQISWPELVYFVRYNKVLTTPELFPSTGPQLILNAGESPERAFSCREVAEVAEVVSGKHSPLLLVVYFDGCVEVWNLSSNSAVKESKAQVLFSTKEVAAKVKKNQPEQEDDSKCFMQAWVGANTTCSESQDKQTRRCSARIHRFKRSVGASGALVRLFSWDSALCVNSSILQESGSGSFRFFRLVNNFLSPVRQVAVGHVKVELSVIAGKSTRKGERASSSSGVVKTFEVTSDGSKIVFLTGNEAILWIVCAGTGEILHHANLLVSQVPKFRSLFQIIEKIIPSGEIQMQLYATTSAKSYRHVEMWSLPQESEEIKSLQRTKIFSFGKTKATTVVQIVVRVDLLFVASRDGLIMVWSTTTDQTSPISPLICLRIPLRNEELQSISCQSLGQECSAFNAGRILVGDNAAADVNRWEVEVLQRFGTPPLRFALYLFDDGEVIRLAVSDQFDVRLLTLDDPAFEFDVFLAPVSGVEPNQARRVILQKHGIKRVLFTALHYSHKGVFAQKCVQEFFQDLEKCGLLWQTRGEMEKFALSYQENVVVELQPYYRRGDGELVELTQPHCIRQTGSTQDTNPVLIVGTTLKSRTGDQTQFQAWKFAMNWLANSEFSSEHDQLDNARRALSLQSSYRLEAERLQRIRRDFSREEDVQLMKDRRTALIRDIKDGVRDIITHYGRPDEAADKLLTAVNMLTLASLASPVGVDPVEAFMLRLFNRGLVQANGDQTCVEIPSLVELMQTEESRSVCFGAWLIRFKQEILATGKLDSEKGVFWNWLGLVVRHIKACTLTTAEVGSLFVDLGLADAFTSSEGSRNDTEDEFSSASSLPSLMQQLHCYLNSTKANFAETMTLDSTMDKLFSPRAVVEFIIECTSFSAFFKTKMTDLWTCVTELGDNESRQTEPEATYALQLHVRKWQQELRQLVKTQNRVHSDISDSEQINILEPTVEDLQQLQRLLKTRLPCGSPKVSSISLENRCDTINCRDRFVMNAIGRLEGNGAEFVPLSVLYLFMESNEDAEQNLQEELTFLRKTQHLRVREYFLPACFDIQAPILPGASASMICSGDTEEIRCIVAESLAGWSSLTDCIKFMRSSTNSVDYWVPLLWLWTIRALMLLLTMQNEQFILRKGIDLDMLLVSPDGHGLRLCSLSGGVFVRCGENEEDADSFCQSMAQVLGFFIYELLLRIFNDEDGAVNFDMNTLEANNDGVLCKMRKQLLCVFYNKSRDDKNYDDRNIRSAFLTEFPSVSQIAVCSEGEEVEKLCGLALLALQPPNTRPGLQSLWVYAGRPGIMEETAQIKTLSRHVTTLAGVQRPLQKLLQDLRLCFEECGDEACDENTLQLAADSWVTFLERLFQLKSPSVDRNVKKDKTNTQIFELTLGQTLDNYVPQQLCTIALRIFTQCLLRGDRDLGCWTVQTLLHTFVKVFELLEANTNFDELQGNSLLTTTLLHVIDSLRGLATGQMPPNHNSGDNTSTPSRGHRDVAVNAVLWRLSEPVFRDLLAIDMATSKYVVLLRWLESRRPAFGFVSTLSLGYEAEVCASGLLDTDTSQLDSTQEIALWWSDHAPLIPRQTPSNAAGDELAEKDCTADGPMTANYLRCVYETKEIEFKLTSGVSVPKFRLAAMQQFFGPVFFEQKRCFPMVFVRPLVATVWRDLAFERLICSLLRDNDEKIVLGALSLLECSTRVLRFDALRSPRIGGSKDAAPGNTTVPSTQPSYTYSCPERTFAMHLCSQRVAIEVKHVLDKTTRALKVLGASGTTSGSRNQHPLVAILCVGMAWLVNCLYGGNGATQFWGIAGIDQLVIAHCKANSLPFVKVKDANMMNQLIRQGQRHAQQDTSKWRVFTSRFADHRSTSHRNLSPFRLMTEEIVFVGSNRAVGLTRTLLQSRTFREAAATEDSAMAARDSAFQRDLLSSTDYGKVSHAMDLARDITQLNGTVNEQVQLSFYARALFLAHTATSARVRVRVFAPVCREIWSWVEAAWRTIVLHSSTGEKAPTLSRAQGDVVLAGFSLLHAIISHPSLLVEDIVELTTFDTDDSANVLHEMVVWITNLPCGVSRRRGSTLAVLVERSVTFLTNSVQSRRYDEVASATVDTCVNIRSLLELLGTTTLSIDEKQQLWSMLLYFDSRIITSRILEMDFLDTVAFSWLLSFYLSTNATENQIASLNKRLEALMLLEMLVFAASRREKSVNTQVLFAEVCKLVLHHDIIAKEAAFSRKARNTSNMTRKLVAVSKRVMQLVCCICVDFSSQKTSRVFLEQLESAGIPAWVIDFHQAQQTEHDNANDEQVSTRAELFWKDWQGSGAIRTKSTNHAMGFAPTRESKSEKTIVQKTPRVQHSVSLRKKPSTQVEALDSDDEFAGVKLERPLVSVSPVKVADSARPKQPATHINAATKKKNPSFVQTLLSIDMDSALRLVKRATDNEAGRKHSNDPADEEALDSDAYSPFPGSSSSDEEIRQRRRRAERKKASAKRKEKKSSDVKQDESKVERESLASSQTRGSDGSSSDSRRSRDRPRRKPQLAKVARKAAGKGSEPAAVPPNQEHEALRAIFRKYDVDGDGAISFIDLRRAMDKQMDGQGHRLSDVEIQRWITEKDRSGQGVVGFHDFAVAFQGQLQHQK